MSNDFTVLSAAHHRNGMNGRPFYVGIVRKVLEPGEPERMFQIIAVPSHDDTPDNLDLVSFRGHEGLFEVYVTSLQITIENETVEFGVNSWRGEHFMPEARAIIKRTREQWDDDLQRLRHV